MEKEKTQKNKVRKPFAFIVTQEQKDYTQKMVDYSIKNHPIPDIFGATERGAAHQRDYRMTGSLGEVVFADLYGLKRPTRAFGAIDGQDNGVDFKLKDKSVDVKSMHRKNNNFWGHYVFNIPSHQVRRNKYKKNVYYCCVSFNEDNIGQTWFNLIGFVNKGELIDGKVGELFERGCERTRQDGTKFIFDIEDTYEIPFRDITPPLIFERFKKMKGFKYLTIFNKENFLE